jgi:CubicO group peptidase (beta-lactamase class C family)
MAGYANGKFEPLADVFARMVGLQGAGGAALTIYAEGRPVVDLVGGDYPPKPRQLLLSVSKAVCAVAAAHASSEGVLDLDAPMGDYWDAFARPGKRSITLRMALSHRAGLPTVNRTMTIDELISDELERALENQEPYWEPGTQHGYHAVTQGAMLVGAFARVLGVDFADYVRMYLAEPLDLDLELGVAEDRQNSVVPFVRAESAITPLQRVMADDSRTIPDPVGAGPISDMSVFNAPKVIAARLPGATMVSSAHSLARLLSATMTEVDGVRLIGSKSLESMIAVQSDGRDRMLGVRTVFGSGMQLPYAQLPFISPNSFGHEGAGGCVAFADAGSGLAVGFITNRYPAVNGASPEALALMASLSIYARGGK